MKAIAIGAWIGACFALAGADDLKRLPERAQMALDLEPTIAELSGRYRFMDHAVVVGGG